MGTERLSFKEMMPTAIISFCVGHETPSGYYTKVPARQKTHVQTQHRYDRRQREGEGVAIAAGRPLMMLAASVLVRSVSRPPSATPFPSLACAGEHLQQPWDFFTGHSHLHLQHLSLWTTAALAAASGHHGSHCCGRSAALQVQRGRSQKERHAYVLLCAAVASTAELA